MRRFFIVAATVWLYAATAGAQTKVTGAAECGKPDPQHMVPVGDHSEHSLGVEQFKCTCTKPMEIGGDKSKDGVSTATTDGAPLEAKGNWGFTGGSGKLKGIKGKGTYTCAPAGDGLACKVDGEYQLAK